MSQREVENRTDSLTSDFSVFSISESGDVPDSYRGEIHHSMDARGSANQSNVADNSNFSFIPNRGSTHDFQERSRPQSDFQGFRTNQISSNQLNGYSELESDNELTQPILPRPRYAEYSMKAVRMASYKSWPTNLRPADIMAESGFFQSTSSSSGDCVRCFQCGIGLRNWDPDDDPWVEHARWANSCPYVKQKKGQAFVDLVHAAVRQAQIEETLQENARDKSSTGDIEVDTPLANGNQKGAAPATNRPSAAEKKNPLLTTAAQSVLEMGYLPKVVKKGVDEVLKERGWVGMNAMNVLDVVMRYEDEEKNNVGIDVADKIMKIPPTGATKEKIVSMSKAKDRETLLAENEEMKEQKTCKICCENTVSIVFLPCGHLVCCAQCSPSLKDCPVCRSSIKGTVRISLS